MAFNNQSLRTQLSCPFNNAISKGSLWPVADLPILIALKYKASKNMPSTSSSTNIASLPNQSIVSPAKNGRTDSPMEPPKAYFEVFVVVVFIPKEFGRFIVSGQIPEQNNPIDKDMQQMMASYCPFASRKIDTTIDRNAPLTRSKSCWLVVQKQDRGIERALPTVIETQNMLAEQQDCSEVIPEVIMPKVLIQPQYPTSKPAQTNINAAITRSRDGGIGILLLPYSQSRMTLYDSDSRLSLSGYEQKTRRIVRSRASTGKILKEVRPKYEVQSGDTNAPTPKLKCSALIQPSVFFLGWMRSNDTVSMILMIMIAIPITKNIELNTNRLSVLPMLPEAIPMTAQLTATALLRLITLSMYGERNDPRRPPIPFNAKAIPRLVYFTPIS